MDIAEYCAAQGSFQETLGQVLEQASVDGHDVVSDLGVGQA